MPCHRINHTIIHMISAVIHAISAGIVGLFWNEIKDDCPTLAKTILIVYGAMFSAHVFVASVKAYFIVSEMCGKPTAKKILMGLSALFGCKCLIISIAAAILLELTIQNHLNTVCMQSGDFDYKFALISSRVFLGVSIVVNLVLSIVAVYIHVKFPEDEVRSHASDREHFDDVSLGSQHQSPKH